MASNDYDVIILGAGPAGLSAAVTLQTSGLRTVVIDRISKATQKIFTVESIHPGVIRQLEYLDLAEGIGCSFKGRYNRISNGDHWKSLNPYSDEIWYGYHICKENFIQSICHKAEQKGVYIKKTEHFPKPEWNESLGNMITLGPERIKGTFLIDATGRKRAGQRDLKNKVIQYSPEYLVMAGVQNSTSEEFTEDETAYFLPGENYWIWIGQLDDQRQCWTAVFRKNDWKSFRKEKLAVDLETADRWASIPWEFAMQPEIPGVFACGDAVGLLDPASGKGIFNAIESGVMAAKVVRSVLDFPAEEQLIKYTFQQWSEDRFLAMANQLKASYDQLGIRI